MRKKKIPLAPYLFLIPNLLVFSVFIILPAGYNFYLSLFDTSPFRPAEFVGLGNFLYLLQKDDLFRRALSNLVIFVFGDVGGMLVGSVLIGILLNQRVKLRGFFRSAFFYPVLLSPVVVALVWQWILNNQFGALNALLTSMGSKGIPWLLVPQWSRFWTIFVHLWATLGFYSLIVLAGLQSIPAELYEAAFVDGADRKRQFYYITIPLLLPTLMTVLVLSTIRGFEIFDHVYILTGGGPGTATLMMVQYIYRAAFQMDQFGLAAAASFLLFLIIFLLTVVQYLLGKHKEAM
ncbi:MAG: sugar ABC transporter permease [Spirochaetes bacterium]|nr:sugar ABC transporter permease [Spirochaetota bacterium]